MKKLLYILSVVAAMFTLASCDDDAWTTDPTLEHIYYVGFYRTGIYTDALNYEVATDGTARWRIGNGTWNVTGSDGTSSDIPFQFYSERVRSYDAVTYFFVTNNTGSNLVAGTDYTVIDASGNALTLADGKYSLTWPQTVKGIQNVRIKRLSNATGALKVNTLDPAKGTPQTTADTYIESTRNSVTGEYEVRGITSDFNKVTVTFN